MKDFAKELEKYFEETPREKVLEDWEKTKEWDQVGPTFDDFMNNNLKIINIEKVEHYIVECENKQIFRRLATASKDQWDQLIDGKWIKCNDCVNIETSFNKTIERQNSPIKIRLIKDYEYYTMTFKTGQVFEENAPDQVFNDIDQTFTICQGMGIYHTLTPDYFEIINE